VSGGAGRLWLSFAAIATAVAAAAAALGAGLFSAGQREAYLVGCAAALAAALAGAIPLALEAVRPGRDAIVAVGKAALFRFVFALGAALFAILGGGLDKGPLLLGLAGTYVILLGAETAYLLWWWRRRAEGGSPAR
jgi:hypothetical protein